MRWLRQTFVCCVVFGLIPASVTFGQLKAAPGDWPGWRGADRTGVSTETGLLNAWPQGGPTLTWKATGLGGGYSTPSIVGDRIYVMGSRDGDEHLLALDSAAGQPVWTVRIGVVGRDGPPSYPGPRCTPMIDGDRIYVLGSDGDLVCLDREGKPQWQKRMVEDLGGQRGRWAYSESPLIDGDLLVCTPGGPQAALVALNKMTGEVVWKSQVPDGGAAAYASIVPVESGGVRQYVQFLGNGLIGVAAADGRFLWQYGKISSITNCSTPIVRGQHVFASTSGRGGSGGGVLLELMAAGEEVSAKEAYFNRELTNHHGGVVLSGDHLYGTNNQTLVCVDFRSGKTQWQDRSVGKGSVTLAEGLLYVRSEKGPVALVEATPEAYREKGRFEPADRSGKNAWCYPVISHGRLYLRDDDLLMCYDVKAR